MTYNWKKSALIAAAMILGAYLCLAVTALNQPDDEKAVCTQVDIVIADGKVDGFLGASEIKEQLQRAKIYPQGQPMKQIDVRKIEEVLQKNPFVKNAEVYKSQGSHVKILLTQRVPVVRVKADNGDDYYIDERGDHAQHAVCQRTGHRHGCCHTSLCQETFDTTGKLRAEQ